jgi:hypothetical protein
MTGMESNRTRVWVVALVSLLLASVGLYVSGYYYLCIQEGRRQDTFVRLYKYRWQARIYSPDAKIDGFVRDLEGSTGYLPRGYIVRPEVRVTLAGFFIGHWVGWKAWEATKQNQSVSMCGAMP